MPLQERTEPATPRKREESRKKGQVARSMEINSALVFLTALLVIRFWGPRMLDSVGGITRECFSAFPTGDLLPPHVTRGFAALAWQTAIVVVPIMAAVMIVGFVSNAAQVGLIVSWEALSPDLNKINPITGLSRLFSVRSWVELAKSVAKVAVVGYIIYAFLRSEYPTVIGLVGVDYIQVGATLGSLCMKLLWRASLALIVIAILDYGFQRHQHEKNLRMTREEVKEEYKRTEGDPTTRSRIRQKQRAMARMRMMQAVPTADAVITNPTHLAIALKYDPDKMNAPLVVAKGARKIAERIKEIARRHGVPIVENVTLAQAIYKSAEVGDEIPATLYRAVAEILAFIYKMNNKYGFGGSGRV